MKDPRPFKALSTLLTAVFLLSSAPLTELRADMDTHREYDCDPLSVTYDQTASWDNTTQAELSITNISEETVDGWTLEIVFPGDITLTNIWNALDISDETTGADTLIVTNETYNAQINPNDAITFGLTAEGSDSAPVTPISVTLITEEEEEQEPIEIDEDQLIYAIFSGSTEEDLTISGWKTEITGDVYTGGNFVYQGSELDVNGYVRTVGTIQPSGWKTDMEGAQENIAPAMIPDWSEELLQRADTIEEDDITVTGQTVTGDLIIVSEGNITLNADTITGDGRVILYSVNGDITIEGTQAEINGILYAPNGRVSINAYEITVNGRIVADKFSYSGAILNVTAGEDDLDFLEEADPTAVPTIDPTLADTPEPTLTDTPVPTPTIADDPFEVKDSDKDGLLDYVETMLGTDPEDPDTDDDYLLDGDELDVGTSPFTGDSDNNGVSDFDEDYDGDGISNGGEYSTGTCMFAEDSDYDGINDHDEIYVYGTDPRDEDSDDDTIIDGDELILGLDPVSPDSDNDGISDDHETFEQEISIDDFDADHPQAVTEVGISGYISGLITSNTVITDMYGADVMSSDVPGLIGVPVNIETSGNFEEMTITFSYDESMLDGADENDLCIMWFDQENGQYVLLDEEQTLDTVNNKVSYVTDHFSKYMLLDKQAWLDAWAESIEEIALARQQYEADHPTGEQYYDFYFLIEASYNTSGTIAGKEYQTLRYFFSNMRDGDRVRIVFFDTRYDVYDFTATNASERDQLLSYAYNYLSSQYVYGGYGSYITAYSGALASINMADDIGNRRMVYVLTEDSDIIKTASTIPTIQSYIDQGDFETGIVMMKQPTVSGFNFAKQIADGVGGDYYQYPLYASLWFYFHNQYGSFVIEEDSDGDGISDMDEICGVLKPNSEIIRTDPESEDTDEDTLQDMEEHFGFFSVDGLYYSSEINVAEELKQNTYISILRYDPTKPDSDDDGYLDTEDANPDKNPDIIYFFANVDFDDKALVRVNEYRNNGYLVRYATFDDYDSFVDDWDWIGLIGDRDSYKDKIYGNKYYYNAENVIIFAHGHPTHIRLNSLDEDFPENIYSSNHSSNIRELVDKKIVELCLYSCLTGAVIENMNDTSLAQDFLAYFPNIGQVVAPDLYLYIINTNFFCVSYNSEETLESTDYNNNYNFLSVPANQTNSVFFVEELKYCVQGDGFCVFCPDNTISDLFPNDVFYGTRYTTQYNIEHNGGCYIELNVVVSNEYMNLVFLNDPIIG